ncbi:MAG: S8 family serine peptidase [Caldilineaceae bacterium]|nr:S8 family serine peptidase [Caldilineaceae bacterium]
MTTFVAVRKGEGTETSAGTRSIEDQRAAAINDTLNEEKADLLLSLGLTQVDPSDRSRHVRHSFHKLDFLKTYVIETSNPAVAERARELLEPEYIVAPDLELTAPRPQISRQVTALPPAFVPWPEASGVASAHERGIMGEGVLVGVLDTGCDADHSEFTDRVIDFRYVPLDPSIDIMRACRGFDVDGHGTHVCGIIGGRQVGIAPKAELMVASVIESETLRTSLERVVIALNWMMAQFQLEENLHKPTIINLSLGYRSEWIGETRVEAATRGIQQILTTLVRDYNVLPIVAIGNDGPGRMRAPAWYPETLSVGAVDHELRIAGFSGGGRSPLLTEIEPDIVGYGIDILSSYERTIAGQSTYAVASGTSMAAHDVAGIAALTASADKTLQGEALRQQLLANALPIDAPHDRVGAGLARFVA